MTRKHNIGTKIPFTKDHVKDKQLVIQMLKFEDRYTKTTDGQELYKSRLNLTGTTLNVIYAIHRYVLDHFDFDTSDESVETYRSIFKAYYNSPTDYDNDVLSSVFYMKANKCVYYTSQEIDVGDKLKNCNILQLDGVKTKLFNVIQKESIENFKYGFVGAFSNS
jgi:hypothetical protein